MKCAKCGQEAINQNSPEARVYAAAEKLIAVARTNGVAWKVSKNGQELFEAVLADGRGEALSHALFDIYFESATAAARSERKADV